MQLRDCNAQVAVLNEIVNSPAAATTRSPTTVPTDAPGPTSPDSGTDDTTGEPSRAPTESPSSGPTATPRDVAAELDRVHVSVAMLRNRSSEEATELRAELVAVRAQATLTAERHERAMAQVATLMAQVSVLEDAAAAVSASAGSDGEGATDNAGGGSGDAAIALAVVAVLLAAAASAHVMHSHREMFKALNAQLDLQTTGGGQQNLGMVDNPLYTHMNADTDGGRRSGNQDGYLAVGSGQQRLNLRPSAGAVYETVAVDGHQPSATYSVLAGQGGSSGGQTYGTARVNLQQGTGVYNRLGEA